MRKAALLFGRVVAVFGGGFAVLASIEVQGLLLMNLNPKLKHGAFKVYIKLLFKKKSSHIFFNLNGNKLIIFFRLLSRLVRVCFRPQFKGKKAFYLF